MKLYLTSLTEPLKICDSWNYPVSNELLACNRDIDKKLPAETVGNFGTHPSNGFTWTPHILNMIQTAVAKLWWVFELLPVLKSRSRLISSPCCRIN